MIHRLLFYGLFLAAVAVLPYLSSEWQKASRSTASGEARADAGAKEGNGSAAVAAIPSAAVAAPILRAGTDAAAQSDAPPLIDLAEAIRFDIAPAWLFQRWPRVTAGLSEGELQGYRVPLVTGTREDDLAGSLTYYFTARQVCQRMAFQGSVGDPRKITAYLTGRFGLTRQKSDDSGLYLYQTRWNGKPVSELRIKAVPVVKASAPYARYDVQMTLNSWARK